MGEKRHKDGKKNRKPIRDGQRTCAIISGITVPTPPLEQLSIPRFQVLEYGVRFWADWNKKQITWVCGRRQEKHEFIRSAASSFCDVQWRTFLEENAPRPNNWNHVKGRVMSILVQKWKDSDAWNEVLEQSYRMFQVQEVLDT